MKPRTPSLTRSDHLRRLKVSPRCPPRLGQSSRSWPHFASVSKDSLKGSWCWQQPRVLTATKDRKKLPTWGSDPTGFSLRSAACGSEGTGSCPESGSPPRDAGSTRGPTTETWVGAVEPPRSPGRGAPPGPRAALASPPARAPASRAAARRAALTRSRTQQHGRRQRQEPQPHLPAAARRCDPGERLRPPGLARPSASCHSPGQLCWVPGSAPGLGERPLHQLAQPAPWCPLSPRPCLR